MSPALAKAPAQEAQNQHTITLPPHDLAVETLHDMILTSLDDDQAVDVVSIPLAGKSSIADYMVVASGKSTRQVASMANKISDKVKAITGHRVNIEGMASADWVLIDAGDVIVHLFRPEVRSFYNLERMWGFTDGPSHLDDLSQPIA